MKLFWLCIASTVALVSAIEPWLWQKHVRKPLDELEEGRSLITPDKLLQLESIIGNFGRKPPTFFNENSSLCHHDMGTIFNWNEVRHPDQEGIFNFWDDIRGRRTPGVMEGSFRWTGNYDQCVDRARFDRLDGKGEFTAKYCWARSSLFIKVGYCFPKSCSESQILMFMPSIVDSTDTGYLTRFVGIDCVDTDEPYDDLAIAGMVVFSFIALVVVIATLYDMLYRLEYIGTHPSATKDSEKPGIAKELSNGNGHIHNNVAAVQDRPTSPSKQPWWHTALMSFSFYTNSLKIWHMTGKDAPGSITCLHGMRVLSLFWVIIGHNFVMGFTYQSNISNVLGPLTEDFNYAWLLRGDFSVDTFFFMSGLLTMYLGFPQVKRFSKSLSKKGLSKGKRILEWLKFWATYYFHRYWRLTPLLAALIFFAVTLRPWAFPYKSPWWTDEVMNCKKTWWTNLLYINNLVYVEEMCQGVTWYLANDMQFYWFSPVVLLSFLASPILGIAILVLGVMEHMIANGIITNYEHFPLSEFAADVDPERQLEIYFVPWCRVGVYLVGMAAGYILLKGKRKMNTLSVLFGWSISTIFGLLITYGMFPVYSGAADYVYNQLLSDWFWSTCRIVWACVLTWVVCACHWGYGGAINHFLSHPAWRPLSRLNYAAYLFHYNTIYFMYQSELHLHYFFKTSMAYMSITIIVFSYAVAHVVSATLEAPFIGIEKLFLPRH